MKDVRSIILDAIQLLSVLLVFAGVIFDLAYQRAQELMTRDMPPGEIGRNQLAAQLRQFLWRRWSLVGTGYFILSYLMAPPAIDILARSKPALLEFDLILSLFLIVWLAVFGFFVWSILVACQLWKRSVDLLRA